MQRIQQIAAVCFIALSGYVVVASIRMEYYTKLGPGPGFFPFWLGSIMGGLSIAWLIQLARLSGKSKDSAFLPEKKGGYQILSILLALSATAVMDVIGFQLTMFLFMIFLLRVVGRTSLWTTLIIALVSSVGVFHLFGRYLDVQLPASSLKMLAAFGL
jgi:putative tricarboxylic transport membrane protein